MNKLTLIVFSLPFLSACSDYMPKLPDMSELTPNLSLPTFYKADVYQGSVLERFTINQLKLGMSQAQVQDLIGSPSVIDPFHNNQWDYINHSTSFDEDTVIRYRLTLTFKNNLLSNIDTTGITSLPELTDKEKKLEDQRIAEEIAAAEAAVKAKIEAVKIAKERAEAAAEAKVKRIAEEKEATKAKALEQKRLTKEKSQVEAKANKEAEIKKSIKKKEQVEALDKKHLIEEKEESETKKKTDKPWYQFW